MYLRNFFLNLRWPHYRKMTTSLAPWSQAVHIIAPCLGHASPSALPKTNGWNPITWWFGSKCFSRIPVWGPRFQVPLFFLEGGVFVKIYENPYFTRRWISIEKLWLVKIGSVFPPFSWYKNPLKKKKKTFTPLKFNIYIYRFLYKG